MKKSNPIRILFIFLIFTSIFSTLVMANSFNKEGFQYRTEKNISLTEEDLFFVLNLEPKLLEKMDPSLKDFRLEANGSELGYSVIPYDLARTIAKEETSLNVLNIGEDQNSNYSFTIKVPMLKIENTNALKIILNQEPYLVKGSMYGSNDNRSWQKLSDITLFSTNNTRNELPLANIDYDYVKIEFKQPYGEKLVVKEALLVSHNERMVRDSSIIESDVLNTIVYDKQEKETVAEIDLGYTNRISSEIIFTTKDKGFNRELILEGSNTKEKWDYIGKTYIYQGIEEKDKNLAYNYHQVNYRYLRVRIFDLDNAPIHFEDIKVRTHPVQLLVKVPSSLLEQQELDLKGYFGNSLINYPNYDVVNFLEKVNTFDLTHYTFDFYQDNPDYKETSMPLTERYPFLLVIALGLTSLLIGYMLYKNIIQSR